MLNFGTPDIFMNLIRIPLFIVCVAVIFDSPRLNMVRVPLAALGNESMNMWFLHALFFTSYTAPTFAFLFDWCPNITVKAMWMIAVTYLMALITSRIYNLIASACKRYLVSERIVEKNE